MIGLDSLIDTCKTVLEGELYDTPLTYTAYGRAFVNERNGRRVPEILAGIGSEGYEYSEMKLNDSLNAFSFFVADEPIKVKNDAMITTVTLYFAVNLRACYSRVSERAVEYVHRDVAAVLKHTEGNLTGILPGWGEFEDAFQNMQPYYLVRFEIEINWLLDQC